MKKIVSFKLFEANEDPFQWLLKLAETTDYDTIHKNTDKQTQQKVAEEFIKLSLDEIYQLFKFGANSYNDYLRKKFPGRNYLGYQNYLPWGPFNKDTIAIELARQNNFKLFKTLVQPKSESHKLLDFRRAHVIKGLAKMLPKSKKYIDWIVEQGYKLSATDLKYVYGEPYDFRKASMYKQLVDKTNWAFGDVTNAKMRQNGTLKIREPHTGTEYSLHHDGSIRIYNPGFGDLIHANLLKKTNIQVKDKQTANQLIEEFILYFYRKALRDNKDIFKQLYKDDKEIAALKPKRDATWQQIEKLLKTALKNHSDLEFKNIPIHVYPADARHLFGVGFLPIGDLNQF